MRSNNNLKLKKKEITMSNDGPPHEHAHGDNCGCDHGDDAAKAAAFAEFERKLADQGISMDAFVELPQHEQIKLLNKYLTSDQEQRKIGASDWREAIEALLEVEPAEQMDGTWRGLVRNDDHCVGLMEEMVLTILYLEFNRSVHLG